MTTTAGSTPAKSVPVRDLTTAAQQAAQWWRRLARALKTCRLYRVENPVSQQARTDVYTQLLEAVGGGGAWVFRITATEIYLLDEPVVKPAVRGADEPTSSTVEQLPFLIFRDGIRTLTFHPGVPRHEFDALFDALLEAGRSPIMHDDLVTLLWQANTRMIQVDAVPLEQTIYLASRRPAGGGGGGGGGSTGLTYAWSPTGSEIRGELGQEAGVAQGLHRDTFDDWELPETSADVVSAYERLLPKMQFARTRLSTEWVAERESSWTAHVPGMMRLILEFDRSLETRQAITQSIVTWLGSAMQRCDWAEAQHAFALMREFDPEGPLTTEALGSAMAGLDVAAITESLDEATPEEQAQFFALAVGIGRPALDLACGVMAQAARARTRAAACTMLCYLCSDDPDLLTPYLTDSRWFVVRNAVFVLGQIGGDAVANLLEMAAHHPDPRVRRQVVQSLGGVSVAARRKTLIAQLDAQDGRLLAATLSMLTREKDPETSRALIKQIEAPDFEARSLDNQRALFAALADVASDEAVRPLENLLNRGGWFARRTYLRLAVARTLHRIGSPGALSALEAGLRSRSEAVRHACLEAMSTRQAP